MTLTPDEIAAKEFGLGLRGYDQHEVRVFLRLIAVQHGLVVSADGETDGFGDAVHQPTGETTPSMLPPVAPMSIDGPSDAAIVLDRAHADADRLRAEAASEAEAIRADATSVLTAAQDQALPHPHRSPRCHHRAGLGTSGSPRHDARRFR